MKQAIIYLNIYCTEQGYFLPDFSLPGFRQRKLSPKTSKHKHSFLFGVCSRDFELLPIVQVLNLLQLSRTVYVFFVPHTKVELSVAIVIRQPGYFFFPLSCRIQDPLPLIGFPGHALKKKSHFLTDGLRKLSSSGWFSRTMRLVSLKCCSHIYRS